jgi:hypothetical protein
MPTLSAATLHAMKIVIHDNSIIGTKAGTCTVRDGKTLGVEPLGISKTAFWHHATISGKG